MSSKAGGPNKIILISLVSFLVLLIIIVGVILFLRSKPQPPAADKCSNDSDCLSGRKCVNGLCKQCKINDDCPTGETCVSGTCKSPSGTTSCTVSTDCKTTELPKCIIPTGSTTGTCKQCGADADCTVGDKTRCRLNSCVAPIVPGKCYYNEDCASVPGKPKCLLPSGATLGTTLGTCSACNANNNCSSGNVCYQGNCTAISAVPPTTCTKTADCASEPTGKTNCLIPTNSLTGLCSTCAVNSNCPTEKPICGSGTCYGCVSDSDCSSGQLCQNGGTSTAKCVEKACSVDSECSAVIPGSVCAYKGTAFASCAIPCTSNTTCNSGDNPNPQTPNCWGYENGNVTQYKFKAGSSYCVPNGPQKCCWNRSLQKCGSTGDVACDSGGEGCVNNGDVTQQYGKVTCNICENTDKIYNPLTGTCVLPYTITDNVLIRGEEVRQIGNINTTDECARKCYDSGDCAMFTYQKDAKVCWQKRPQASDSSYASYFRHGNNVYTLADNMRTTSHDLDRGSANSSQCQAKCEEYGNQCYGYMINKNDPNSCWIKGQFASTNHASGNIRKNF